MTDNYAIQLANAQKFFLTYDQEKLIKKFRLQSDENYLYIPMFSTPYRLNRRTGKLERFAGDWQDANTFGEVMTLLDLVCDSREGKFIYYELNTSVLEEALLWLTDLKGE